MTVPLASWGQRSGTHRAVCQRRPSKIAEVCRFLKPNYSLAEQYTSAFFDRPITIATVYSNTYRHISSDLPAVFLSLPPDSATIAAASLDKPLLQKRQVHLQCSGKTVCIATSQVRITSPECARLFLVEKYAIGQMFARMEKVPSFELVSVGIGPVIDDTASETTPLDNVLDESEHEQLWRKYKLHIPDFECEILEVFPAREMFVEGTSWLDGTRLNGTSPSVLRRTSTATPATPKFQANLMLFLGLGFVFMTTLEASRYLTYGSRIC